MMAQVPMSTLQLSHAYPEAWEALPECYRSDSCLEFYRMFDILFCKPTPEELPILGEWECYYSDRMRAWVDTKTGRPIDV